MNNNLDKIAENYHLQNLPDMHIERICQEYEVDWLIENIAGAGQKVLELGYGDGVNFESLARHCSLTLVEGSEELAKKARLRSAEIGLSTAVHCCFFEDFEQDGNFDVILASHVLEHVNKPVELLVHLSQLLRPGGTLIGLVPNAESLHRRLGVAMGLNKQLDDLSERDLLVGHQRVYDLAMLKNDMTQGGFVITNHRGFFAKLLANHQILHLEEKVLRGLLKMSDNLPTELCANLAFVAKRTVDVK
jgi:2-polyprenyl-3-methyl-5-hydroxy-6-metoxy-1,4-benzoquinol methylase